MPDAAITTDIIVGFPGETEQDFQDTMRVASESRFSASFTFQYSKRPGTPAAEMDGQIEKPVVQERYERLLAHVNNIAWEENQKLIGREVEVLIANDERRKDAVTHRLTGRARDNRLVHVSLPVGVLAPRPGDIVTATVTDAGPFHLIADAVDAEDVTIRKTRAGDAWDLAQAASCGVPATSAADEQPKAVSLGLPTVRRLQ